MLRYLVLFALLFATGAGQPTATPGSSPKPAAAAAQPDTAHRTPGKSPGTAVLLSFLLPGGGQVYTHSYWQAAIIAPAELALGYFDLRENRAANAAWRDNDTSGYLAHRNRRTTLLWFTGAVLAFSMADAYVSAQMYGFDREMRFALGNRRLRVAVAPLRIALEAGI